MKALTLLVHPRRMLAAAPIVPVLFAMLVMTAFPAAATPLIKTGERLSLRRAIAITLANHPARVAAQFQAGAAAQRVGEARSRLLPQIFGAAQYLRTTDNAIGDTSYLNPGFISRFPGSDHDAPQDIGQSPSTGNNYLLGVGAYQYLLDFGRAHGYVAQRSDEAAAAAARTQLVELGLIFGTTKSYYGILAARETVRVYQKAVSERGQQLLEARVKAKTGLASELDVYSEQAALARAQLHLLDARDNLAKALVALNVAMGLGDGVPSYSVAAPPDPPAASGSAKQSIRAAFIMRPDLRIFTDEARAAGAKVTEYRSDYFPTVNAVAGYSAMGTGLPAANNFGAGIVITWPIFNGLLTRHQVEEAKLRENALRESIKGLRQQIYFQVESAFLDRQTAVKRIERARVALAASHVELELAEKRYAVGLGNIVELTQAQREYVDDDTAYVEARYDYAVARAALKAATGQSISRL
ncbi:MAG: TolC family protein [Candidatus Binataceae bacterium]